MFGSNDRDLQALLIVRFKALRRISLDSYRVGAVIAAALVLLHYENDRII